MTDNCHQITSYLLSKSTWCVSALFDINSQYFPFRNIKRQPLSPGILTTVGQFLATICMVIPKILLVSSTFIYAPFLFPIAYVFEYLLIIGYNKLITGSANGKWFFRGFFCYLFRNIFYQSKFTFKYGLLCSHLGRSLAWRFINQH